LFCPKIFPRFFCHRGRVRERNIRTEPGSSHSVRRPPRSPMREDELQDVIRSLSVGGSGHGSVLGWASRVAVRALGGRIPCPTCARILNA
jgi:hypothetical protein